MPFSPDLAPPAERWVYLDNAASTPPAPYVIDSYPDLLRQSYANASAAHRFGYRLRLHLRRQGELLMQAADIEGGSADIIWTSGGTEANNLALRGHLAGVRPAEALLLIGAAEHASVAETAAIMAREGVPVVEAPIDAEGKLRLDQLAALLRPTTRLVSICLAQNETGVLQDLVSVRRTMDAHAPQALLHTDAVQAFGKCALPWREARIDLLSLSAHKFHGPGGVGALIFRRGISLSPLLHGGGQQGNLRSGSLDAVGIEGLVIAAQLQFAHRAEVWRQVEELNRLTRERLHGLRDRRGKPLPLRLISPADASPYILAFSLPGFQGAVLARQLGERGVIIGTGSACAAESARPSRVLTAMGLSNEVAFGTLRISFASQNSVDDIDIFARELQQAILDY